jgi:threonine dehydrogenase-like Zn-dependent dehydrogenase
MNAVVWMGKKNVEVQQVEDPQILDPRDCIVKITSTAICGSDSTSSTATSRRSAAHSCWAPRR